METTNNMNELEVGIRAVSSAVNQLQSWPVTVVLVLALVLVGMSIRLSHALPNRFAPWAIMILGIVANVFLGDPGKVDPTQRYPHVVLGLYGLMLAFMSLAIYGLTAKRIERLFPQFNAEEDDDKPSTPPNQ